MLRIKKSYVYLLYQNETITKNTNIMKTKLKRLIKRLCIFMQELANAAANNNGNKW